MSKIALKPNASGTGVFSLEAPNSNVDRTLNLPDEAGTVLTDAGVSGSLIQGDVSLENITANGQITANSGIRSPQPVFFGGKNQPIEFSPYHLVHGFDLARPNETTNTEIVDLITFDYSNSANFIEQSVFIEFGARVQGGSTSDSNSHSFSKIYGINRFTGTISLDGPTTTGTDAEREVFVRVFEQSNSVVKVQAVFESAASAASFCWGQVKSYNHGGKFNTGKYANDGNIVVSFFHGWDSQ